MANYQLLKADIDTKVYQNGQQEITGENLNSVLNAMVDSLGAGYQFMGVATPTNPGTAQTPDYKCFYLTTTPGIYTNLGGLVVAEGEVAILKYDTAWTKEVTGAATTDQVNQLGQKVEYKYADTFSLYAVGKIKYLKVFSPHFLANGEGEIVVTPITIGASTDVVCGAYRNGTYIILTRTIIDGIAHFSIEEGDELAEIYVGGGNVGDEYSVDIKAGWVFETENLSKQVDGISSMVGINTLENVSGYLVGSIVYIKQYSPRVALTENTNVVVKRITGVANTVMAVVFRNGVETYLTFTQISDGTFLLELQNGDSLDSIYLTRASGGVVGDQFSISLKTCISKDIFDTQTELDSFEGKVGDSRSESVSAYKTGKITYIKEFSPHLITNKQTTIVAERNSGDAYEVLTVVKRGGSELYLRFTRISENNFKFVTQAGDELLSFYISGGAVGDTFTLKYLQGTFSDIWESNVKIESLENRVYRKSLNWIAIGDSLTDVQTLGAGVDNYVNLVAKTLGLNAINKGVSGTGYMKEQDVSQAFYQRIPNFTEDADIVTIFGSFNDLSAGTLGTALDTDTTTVGGCMNETIDALTTKYPNALIGIIAPTPWWESFDYTTYPQYRQYVELLKDVAKRYSIPFLNLFDGSNLRPWDDTFNYTYFKHTDLKPNGDGCHPNTAGHKRFAELIAEFMKGVIFPISTY